MPHSTVLSLISSVIIAASIIFVARQLPYTQITIKDSSPVQSLGWVATNTINVDGDGKVMAQPDMVILMVAISEVAKTTAEAQKSTNLKIDQLKTILKQGWVADKDVQSSNISLYPEYDYNGTRSILSGYRSNHTLTITIKNSDPSGAVVSKLIDQIVVIPSVQLQNISYDIEDKSVLLGQARELAFQKAQQKAEQLAKLGGLTLDKPLAINESIAQSIAPYPMNRNVMAMDIQWQAEQAPSVWVAPGQLEVSLQLNIVRGVK